MLIAVYLSFTAISCHLDGHAKIKVEINFLHPLVLKINFYFNYKLVFLFLCIDSDLEDQEMVNVIFFSSACFEEAMKWNREN